MRTIETLLALALFAPATATQTDVWAIEHVRVIPMDTERTLDDHTVVVEGSVITALGPTQEISPPEGALTIDGRGRTLIPGLSDMHVHLLADERIADQFAPDELKVMVANGVTTARIMIGTPLHLELRERIATGDLVAPWIHVASPQLSHRSFGKKFNGRAVTDPESARAAVREFAATGYDYVKLTFELRPEVYDAVIEASAQAGLPVVGHVGYRIGLDRALKAGQQIEHLDQYLEALFLGAIPREEGISGPGVWRMRYWPNVEMMEEAFIPTVARKVAAAGVWNTPTLAYMNTTFGTGLSDEQLESHPDLRFLSPDVKANLLKGRDRFWEDPPAEKYRQRYVELRNAFTKGLYEAGAKLMAGSESPGWTLLYGFTLHRELEALVAAGLPPWAALETATRNPAEWLGTSDHTGTIAVGKQADLVLLAADPLEDITNTTRIEGVALRGAWFDRAALDGLLDASAERLSQANMRPSTRPPPPPVPR